MSAGKIKIRKASGYSRKAPKMKLAIMLDLRRQFYYQTFNMHEDPLQIHRPVIWNWSIAKHARYNKLFVLIDVKLAVKKLFEALWWTLDQLLFISRVKLLWEKFFGSILLGWYSFAYKVQMKYSLSLDCIKDLRPKMPLCLSMFIIINTLLDFKKNFATIFIHYFPS